MSPFHLCRGVNWSIFQSSSNLPFKKESFVMKWSESIIISEANLGRHWSMPMGLLPDTQNRGLRMRRECRERFPRHRVQRKLLVSDPGMHHGTCVTHVPWCMSGSLNCGSDGKRSQDSRRTRNSQFYVSGKRPMMSLPDVSGKSLR